MNTRTLPTRGTLVPVLIGVAASAVLLGLLVGGRALLQSHYEESRSYAAAADIPDHNGVFRLPEWAPTDATDITINAQTQGKGKSLHLVSAADLADGCTTSAHPSTAPVPDVDLPASLADSPGLRCGEWFVVRDGDQVFAWTAYRN